ncbi:hypothetical protein [Erwinia oleae]|uniref:hypothetical protein n=1 Tax=Erwinia oleae TaxID=796334 RepID=UPI0012699794|nr:hypothetical protein [Erwinia oleae]
MGGNSPPNIFHIFIFILPCAGFARLRMNNFHSLIIHLLATATLNDNDALCLPPCLSYVMPPGHNPHASEAKKFSHSLAPVISNCTETKWRNNASSVELIKHILQNNSSMNN